MFIPGRLNQFYWSCLDGWGLIHTNYSVQFGNREWVMVIDVRGNRVEKNTEGSRNQIRDSTNHTNHEPQQKHITLHAYIVFVPWPGTTLYSIGALPRYFLCTTYSFMGFSTTPHHAGGKACHYIKCISP